ncbi:MAG TPA: hypothetical protein VK403_10845 [Allosphingosinicella sp.]|nr:hypothetical protein [Allosphingosinicella sp.]
MKKLVLTTLATGMLAMPALAQTFPNPAGYESRGACQSAFMKARNEVRQNPDMRHPNDKALTPSEYNRADRENWECRQAADGRWYFVRR